jgi:hypothetical protein
MLLGILLQLGHYPNALKFFLPVNIMPLLQPMEQGLIATFKAHHLHTMYDKLDQQQKKNEPTVKQFWKSFNIILQTS